MFMGNSALAGKRLLVIRSHRRQDDFLDLLKDMDCDVLHKPILDLKPVNNIETIKKQISNFDEFDIAIFVSFHAAPNGDGHKRIGLTCFLAFQQRDFRWITIFGGVAKYRKQKGYYI
jgi:hypothetical protein